MKTVRKILLGEDAPVWLPWGLRWLASLKRAANGNFLQRMATPAEGVTVTVRVAPSGDVVVVQTDNDPKGFGFCPVNIAADSPNGWTYPKLADGTQTTPVNGTATTAGSKAARTFVKASVKDNALTFKYGVKEPRPARFKWVSADGARVVRAGGAVYGDVCYAETTYSGNYTLPHVVRGRRYVAETGGVTPEAKPVGWVVPGSGAMDKSGWTSWDYWSADAPDGGVSAASYSAVFVEVNGTRRTSFPTLNGSAPAYVLGASRTSDGHTLLVCGYANANVVSGSTKYRSTTVVAYLYDADGWAAGSDGTAVGSSTVDAAVAGAPFLPHSLAVSHDGTKACFAAVLNTTGKYNRDVAVFEFAIGDGAVSVRVVPSSEVAPYCTLPTTSYAKTGGSYSLTDEIDSYSLQYSYTGVSRSAPELLAYAYVATDEGSDLTFYTRWSCAERTLAYNKSVTSTSEPITVDGEARTQRTTVGTLAWSRQTTTTASFYANGAAMNTSSQVASGGGSGQFNTVRIAGAIQTCSGDYSEASSESGQSGFDGAPEVLTVVEVVEPGTGVLVALQDGYCGRNSSVSSSLSFSQETAHPEWSASRPATAYSAVAQRGVYQPADGGGYAACFSRETFASSLSVAAATATTSIEPSLDDYFYGVNGGLSVAYFAYANLASQEYGSGSTISAVKSGFGSSPGFFPCYALWDEEAEVGMLTYYAGATNWDGATLAETANAFLHRKTNDDGTTEIVVTDANALWPIDSATVGLVLVAPSYS